MKYIKLFENSNITSSRFLNAVSENNLYLVQYYLDRGGDPSIDNSLAIEIASENGDTVILKLLLQDPRVDPTINDNNPIRMSSQEGYTEIVKLLLKDKRVDPSDLDNYAISWAYYNKHIEIVKLLLTHPKVYTSLSDEEKTKYLGDKVDEFNNWYLENYTNYSTIEEALKNEPQLANVFIGDFDEYISGLKQSESF